MTCTTAYETKHRGIGFSVVEFGENRWRWTLHPRMVPGTLSKIESGELFGKREDAVAAAKKAIDAKFAENPNYGAA
jgi:hypothetical protein